MLSLYLHALVLSYSFFHFLAHTCNLIMCHEIHVHHNALKLCAVDILQSFSVVSLFTRKFPWLLLDYLDYVMVAVCEAREVRTSS